MGHFFFEKHCNSVTIFLTKLPYCYIYYFVVCVCHPPFHLVTELLTFFRDPVEEKTNLFLYLFDFYVSLFFSPQLQADKVLHFVVANIDPVKIHWYCSQGILTVASFTSNSYT